MVGVAPMADLQLVEESCQSESATRMRWLVYIPPPLGRFFRARYLHSWNGVGAKTGSALERSRRELSEDLSIVRYWHPLGCPAIELGKPRGGWCDMHRPIRYFNPVV